MNVNVLTLEWVGTEPRSIRCQLYVINQTNTHHLRVNYLQNKAQGKNTEEPKKPTKAEPYWFPDGGWFEDIIIWTYTCSHHIDFWFIIEINLKYSIMEF
jgi:hypothetical protein